MVLFLTQQVSSGSFQAAFNGRFQVFGRTHSGFKLGVKTDGNLVMTGLVQGTRICVCRATIGQKTGSVPTPELVL